MAVKFFTETESTDSLCLLLLLFLLLFQYTGLQSGESSTYEYQECSELCA